LAAATVQQLEELAARVAGLEAVFVSLEFSERKRPAVVAPHAVCVP
jgi:hypothetical protein